MFNISTKPNYWSYKPIELLQLFGSPPCGVSDHGYSTGKQRTLGRYPTRMFLNLRELVKSLSQKIAKTSRIIQHLGTTNMTFKLNSGGCESSLDNPHDFSTTSISSLDHRSFDLWIPTVFWDPQIQASVATKLAIINRDPCL